jgi:benzoylformate decarboxylase
VAARSGAELLVEILRDEGVRHVFGNPGTTELPLVDALADHPELEYVLALQEASAVGMADGYARATGRPAFVNLHTVAGLANGLGNVTNAAAVGTPLVVTAGQQDRRHLIAEPLLSGDLVGLARPLVKWSHEVRTLGELGVAVRRAFRLAAATPSGPVFLALPMDVLTEVGDVAAPARSAVDEWPVAASLYELAQRLAAAERPAIVVGNELARLDGADDAVALADALAAPVYGAPLYAWNVFPPAHPLWRGPLPNSAAAIAEELAAYDRVLLLGARAFLVYPYTPGGAVPAGAELLQVHPDAAELGRTYPVALGVVGDPAAAARALAELVPRRPRSVEADAGVAQRLAEQVEAARATTPIGAAAAVAAVYSRLPANAVVVDESVTASPFTRGLHPGGDALSFIWCGAGALGWGLPAAVGVKLARPERAVVAVCGDGSALYAPQALWSAARYGVPVVTVILDNREYRILKHALDRMEGVSARTGRYVGMDLVEPAVDVVALARSFGVSACSVEGADELADAVGEALAAEEPRLVHVPIAGHAARTGEHGRRDAQKRAASPG